VTEKNDCVVERRREAEGLIEEKKVRSLGPKGRGHECSQPLDIHPLGEEHVLIASTTTGV